MGKMRKVPSLDCAADFATNARRVVAVRRDEMYANAGALADESDSVGLHDLRISIKRLRYSLEFFAVCFDAADMAWLLAGFSDMQDLLGDLHDADVLVPELRTTLGELEDRRALEARRAAREAAPEDEAGQFATFRERIDHAPPPAEALGLLALLERMREQRSRCYHGARELWEKLEAEGMRARLDRMAGDKAPDPEAPTGVRVASADGSDSGGDSREGAAVPDDAGAGGAEDSDELPTAGAPEPERIADDGGESAPAAATESRPVDGEGAPSPEGDAPADVEPKGVGDAPAGTDGEERGGGRDGEAD